MKNENWVDKSDDNDSETQKRLAKFHFPDLNPSSSSCWSPFDHTQTQTSNGSYWHTNSNKIIFVRRIAPMNPSDILSKHFGGRRWRSFISPPVAVVQFERNPQEQPTLVPWVELPANLLSSVSAIQYYLYTVDFSMSNCRIRTTQIQNTPSLKLTFEPQRTIYWRICHWWAYWKECY
jgi:hypothetical protein